MRSDFTPEHQGRNRDSEGRYKGVNEGSFRRISHRLTQDVRLASVCAAGETDKARHSSLCMLHSGSSGASVVLPLTQSGPSRARQHKHTTVFVAAKRGNSKRQRTNRRPPQVRSTDILRHSQQFRGIYLTAGTSFRGRLGTTVHTRFVLGERIGAGSVFCQLSPVKWLSSTPVEVADSKLRDCRL